MSWWKSEPEPEPEGPPEPEELFIRVVPDIGDPHYFEAEDYSTHYPGDGRLVIQKNERRTPAMTYGKWNYVHHVMRKPSEVERFIPR